jgi:hypothetical protein
VGLDWKNGPKMLKKGSTVLLFSITTVVLLTSILCALYLIYNRITKMPKLIEKPYTIDQMLEVMEQNNDQNHEIILQLKSINLRLLELKMLA